MKKTILSLSLFSVSLLPAQLPSTEVWLFSFTMSAGTYNISSGANVSNNPGYDNQPSFSENGSYMLYTSQRDSNETDILRYDVRMRTTQRLTQTAFSEYSPTYMEGNKYISAVVVEKDSVQRLWRYNKMNAEAKVIMPKVFQVGYHCWYDVNTVFLFQVTEPSSLVLADVRTGSNRTIISDVGRCMQIYKSPKKKLLLYTQQDTSGAYWIKALDGNGLKVTDFAPIKAPGSSQDFAVDKNGNLVMADGTKVYQWTIGKSTEWKQVADLSGSGLHKITRLAISPDGVHIAFVDNL